MSQYSQILNYLQTSGSSALTKALALNSYIYSSYLPGGYGIAPLNVYDAAESGRGLSCGWREYLFITLFKDAGFEARAINFYDMPFQGNHTTLEIKIDGSWVWFDPTFGTVFKDKNGDLVSASYARNNSSTISVFQANTDGWTGLIRDLSSMESVTYRLVKDFLYRPSAWSGSESQIGAEIESLYFGGDSKYFPDQTPIAIGGYSFKDYIDNNNSFNWLKYTVKYNKFDKIVSSWGLYDEGYKNYAWFIKYDSENIYSWAQRKYYFNGIYIDNEITVFDDNHIQLVDYDELNNNIIHKKTLLKYMNNIINSYVEYDNNNFYYEFWDVNNQFNFKYIKINSQKSIITNAKVINELGHWELNPFQIANLSNNADTYNNSFSVLVNGMDGNDRLIGSPHNDVLFGGAGDDIYYVNNISDYCIEHENQGIDEVRSYVNYILPLNIETLNMLGGSNGTGNFQDNNIYGNSLNNVLMGLSGNDRIYAGVGNDLIIGGLGSDLLFGGKDLNSDIFDFNDAMESKMGSLRDTIFNFISGVDKIDISDIDANINQLGKQNFIFKASKPAIYSIWYKDAELDGVLSTKDLIVYGDIDGNLTPDFEIGLVGSGSLKDMDFI